ncbi:MAG: hypothetical protein WCQ44_00465 [Opitutaceae bacterium]
METAEQSWLTTRLRNTVVAMAAVIAGGLDHTTAKAGELSPKDYRDFYGITWNGDNQSNLQFAKQMGYDFIMYRRGMESHELATDIGFYLESPQYAVSPVPRSINLDKTYPAKEREIYEKYFAKKSGQPFPTNMATGWFSAPRVFSVEPDFQDQEVVDYFVARIIAYATSLERRERNFVFSGYAWDVPNLTGDFWDKMQAHGGKDGGGKQISLAFWTGADRAYQPAGAVFSYSTYSDGHAAFYRQLFLQTRARFPEARFIIEPYKIWEDWLALVKDRSDVKEIMPDLILQESGGNQVARGTEFATDKRIFDSGLIKGHGSVGSTTPNCFGEKENREIAAQAAVNGSVFGWFGRFGGTGNMPGYKNIREVPARLQLIRRVAAWENRNGIPLSERSWDGRVYSSPGSHISESVIWSTHPKTGKIFVVWLEPDGVVRMPPGLKFASIQRTDNLFMETASGAEDVTILGNEVRLKSSAGLGQGYIISANRE